MTKLVEILARAFIHWPEGANSVIYGDCGSTAYFDMGVAYRACIYLDELERSQLGDGIHVVTRAEWQAEVDALKAKDIASSTAAMIDAGWIDPRPPVSPSLHAQVVGRANRIPEWDGDGLPPVGANVEVVGLGKESRPKAIEDWKDGDKVECIAHHVMWEKDLKPVFFNKRTMQFSSLRKDCYRPVRTPEQIAAEERESAINGMLTHDALGGSRRGLAAALYDAGYRKQEQK